MPSICALKSAFQNYLRPLVRLLAAAIVAANHNSHLDTLVLFMLFSLRLIPRVRPVAAADYFLANRLIAWFSLNVSGIIPIERKRRQACGDPLAYCNCGHDAPLIGRAGAGFNAIECAGGMLLGAVPDAHCQSGSITLERGDVVLCYTDGVTEAANRAQELFTDRRLLDSIAGMEQAEAGHLVRVLHAEIRAFVEGAPQSDDITVLALKYRGKS